MIARLGYFGDFDFTDREYVLEALADLDGFRGVYHLVDPGTGRGLSISLWDSAEEAEAGQEAVGQAARAGGHGGPGPDHVEAWDVVRHRVAR